MFSYDSKELFALLEPRQSFNFKIKSMKIVSKLLNLKLKIKCRKWINLKIRAMLSNIEHSYSFNIIIISKRISSFKMPILEFEN